MSAVSIAFLKTLAPRATPEILQGLVAPLAKWTVRYGITSSLRFAHFIAQAAQETDGFKVLAEYASGKAYEGRKDLGNTHPGDGVRFKGRGIFMLTGRANYAFYGKLIGVDLVSNPDLAMNPDVAVQLACAYWQRKGLNGWADKDDIKAVTYRINGGYNGLKDRQAYLDRAKKLLGVSGQAAVQIDGPDDQAVEAPIVPISPSPTTPWWKGGDVWSLALAGVSALGQVFSGATGVAAWALLLLVVGGLAFATYFVLSKRHIGH
jgi:predicted chitinase